MLKTARFLAAVSLCALIAACTPQQQAAVSSACSAISIAQNTPAAAAQLNAIDPHSALGVIWADAQSGCNGAIPVAGVDASWTAQIWAMAKELIPIALPVLVGMI